MISNHITKYTEKDKQNLTEINFFLKKYIQRSSESMEARHIRSAEENIK
jgi:hypothetical protein